MKVENLHTTDCIRTHSGIYMNVFEPTLDMIDINDIAHALSNQCRFGGHLPVFYSVAQHSIHVCDLCFDHPLAALLHDASEAYLLDVPRPVKHKLLNYKEIECRLMTLIAQKFGFDWPLHPEVKTADEQMLNLEWHNLMLQKSGPIEAKHPADAKDQFLKRFNTIASQQAFRHQTGKYLPV